jgi:hypothetical protein
VDLRFRACKAGEDANSISDRFRIKLRSLQRLSYYAPIDMAVICMMRLPSRAVIMVVVVVMIMMMVVMGRSIGFRLLPVSPNTEAPAGEDPIIVSFQGHFDPLQQRARRYHFAQSLLEIRAQIEKCGNKHIASDAADRVKVDFGHAPTGSKRGTT